MYQNINAKETDYLYTQTSQLPNAGLGLFTAIPIFKEEIISVFKGKLLTKTQAEAIIAKKEDQYFINLLNGSILDSKNVKCFAKYANDAQGFAKSNFKNKAKITLNEKNEVCLVAIKKINAGEEIFCSYGKKYWKKHGI